MKKHKYYHYQSIPCQGKVSKEKCLGKLQRVQSKCTCKEDDNIRIEYKPCPEQVDDNKCIEKIEDQKPFACISHTSIKADLEVVQKENVTIHGKVQNQCCKPIANARIILYGTVGGDYKELGHTFSNQDGIYQFNFCTASCNIKFKIIICCSELSESRSFVANTKNLQSTCGYECDDCGETSYFHIEK